MFLTKYLCWLETRSLGRRTGYLAILPQASSHNRAKNRLSASLRRAQLQEDQSRLKLLNNQGSTSKQGPQTALFVRFNSYHNRPSCILTILRNPSYFQLTLLQCTVRVALHLTGLQNLANRFDADVFDNLAFDQIATKILQRPTRKA